MNTTAARGQIALAMNEAVQQNGYAMVSTEDDNVQEDDASSNTSTYGHRRLAQPLSPHTQNRFCRYMYLKYLKYLKWRLIWILGA